MVLGTGKVISVSALELLSARPLPLLDGALAVSGGGHVDDVGGVSVAIALEQIRCVCSGVMRV